MADLWRDFWIRETGTGQQVAQLHDRYMMMMMMMMMMMKIYMGEWKYTSTQSCTRYWLWWVVTFMAWSLYFRRKSTRYYLDRRLSGSQSQSTLFEGEKKLLPLLEVEWRLLSCTVRSLVIIGTALCRLIISPCFLITNLWTFGKRCSSIYRVELSPWRTALLHKTRVYYQIEKLLAFYGKRTSLPAESSSICLVPWIRHTHTATPRI